MCTGSEREDLLPCYFSKGPLGINCTWQRYLVIPPPFFLKVYLFQRERERESSTSGGGEGVGRGEMGRGRESQAMLSMELDSGLDLKTLKSEPKQAETKSWRLNWLCQWQSCHFHSELTLPLFALKPESIFLTLSQYVIFTSYFLIFIIKHFFTHYF